MKIKINKFVLFLCSLLFSFLAVEVFFRIYFELNTSYQIEMWKYNRELKFAVQDSRNHFHQSNKTAKLMNVPVRTNNYGFRGDALNESQVADSVVVLGDSLTLGWGVLEEETFCKIISKKINLNCINAGVGNYTLRQIVENYRQQNFFTKAKHIIYFFYINDAEPEQDEFKSELCIRSVACVLVVNALNSMKSSADYENFYRKFYAGESWQKFSHSLSELVEVVGSNRLTVVLLPEFRNVNARPFINEHAKIQAQLVQQGVRVIDLIDFPKVDTAAEYWVSADDPHPNAKAHKLIAELVAEKLDFLK